MDIEKVISIIRTLKEEGVVAVPTNSVSSGAIAGTRAAGDDPPVRKIYATSGIGSRKKWLDYLNKK